MVWLVIGVILTMVFMQVGSRQAGQNVHDYSTFMEEARQGHISKVKLDSGRTIKATSRDGKNYTVFTPGIQDPWMVGDLMKYNVTVEAKPEEEPSLLMNIFVSWFPMLLLIGVWIFFMRQMQGGGRGGAFSFGKSRARMIDESNNSITFADVAGCEEAKEEVAELVDFLRDPAKFQKLGGRIPKGVLMVGNPGTGKTLLARAIAGEAKVPFFSISGSDFVEMFVGVGAARVRDMFEQAKKHAPCIVFIDEIDAVGRQRGAGLGGGNDEREQTLNQLLVEMDGFEATVGVIVIAATNRPDVLDPALLRPGRFDRQVVVPLPDIRGREEILKVHMRKVPLSTDVKPDIIARGTPGFSGADLANLVNEAALFAARSNKRLVDMDDFERAKDKIIMGAERRSMVMPEEERRNTAYHESGHAVIARRMVTQWGMSDELGPMVYGENEGEIFLGRSITTHKNVSEATMQKVDAEIRRIVDVQYHLARKLLEDNRDKVEAMAKALLELETIDADQIADIMSGKPPRPPKPSGSQSAAKPPASDGGTEGATAPAPSA